MRSIFDPRVTRALALLCLSLSAISFSPQIHTTLTGMVFALPGVGVLWWYLRRTAPLLHPETVLPTPHHAPVNSAHLLMIGGGVVMLLMTAAGGVPQHHTLALSPLHISAQMALFIGGIIALCIGASGITWRAFISIPRLDVPLLAIIALGFALRVVNLEHAVHLFVDEQHFSNGVVHLRGDPYTPLFTPMNLIASFPWFYSVLQTATVTVFGTTLSGIRAISVIFGTLTIPAVYLLGRWLYDRKLGMLAALILATFPPHIHFSRLALNNIADPFFGTLALAFFARGIARGGRGNFVLAGACLGLTQIFYEGGKILFPAILGMWVIVALVGRRISLKQALLTVGVFGLVALPMMLTLLAWESAYIPRLEGQMALSEATDDTLTEKFIHALAHFVSRPDSSNFYYAGGTALLLPVMLPAFFAGLATIAYQRRGWMLPVILLLTMVGNSLIEFPDWSARFVVAFPALALMMALGWRTLWRVLHATHTPTTSPTNAPSFLEFIGIRRFKGGVWALVILIAVVPALHYFAVHLPLYNHQIRPTFDHQDVGFRARELPENTRIYLLTGAQVFMPHFQGMSRYWERPLDVQLEIDGNTAFQLEEVQRRVPVAIFVAPGDVRAIAELDRLFDLPEPRYSPFNVPLDKQYLLYFLEPEQ